MAQWLREFIAFWRIQVGLPARTKQLTTIYTFSSKGIGTFSHPLQVPGTHAVLSDKHKK